MCTYNRQDRLTYTNLCNSLIISWQNWHYSFILYTIPIKWVDERCHRKLVNYARCKMNQPSMSFQDQTEMVYTHNHEWNTHELLQHTSPWQRIYASKFGVILPNESMMHTWIEIEIWHSWGHWQNGQYQVRISAYLIINRMFKWPHILFTTSQYSKCKLTQHLCSP